MSKKDKSEVSSTAIDLYTVVIYLYVVVVL